MKKKYIQPCLTVVKTDVELPIAGSLVVDKNPDNELHEGEFLTKERDEESVNIWGNNF